jgi:hypothetical protein
MYSRAARQQAGAEKLRCHLRALGASCSLLGSSAAQRRYLLAGTASYPKGHSETIIPTLKSSHDRGRCRYTDPGNRLHWERLGAWNGAVRSL